MDAGIMDGTSLLFGAVGAVSGTDSVVTRVISYKSESDFIMLNPVGGSGS